MHYLTATQAAQVWGVTPRRVQDLCKQGRIPGARLWHRAWMIPPDAVYPTNEPDHHMPMPRKSPFLDMTNLYHQPGTASSAIQALAHLPEAKALRERIGELFLRAEGTMN